MTTTDLQEFLEKQPCITVTSQDLFLFRKGDDLLRFVVEKGSLPRVEWTRNPNEATLFDTAEGYSATYHLWPKDVVSVPVKVVQTLELIMT